MEHLMVSCASSMSRELNAYPLHYTLFRWRTYCVGLAGWQAALCLGVRGLATPFLFHKCSSDVAIFSWSQSQNLIGPLRTYAFAVQVSLIIVANPVKDQMDFEVWRYNTKFLAWVEILPSRYVRSWIAQFILALFTFKYGRNNFIFFSIFLKVPNSLSFVQR